MSLYYSFDCGCDVEVLDSKPKRLKDFLGSVVTINFKFIHILMNKYNLLISDLFPQFKNKKPFVVKRYQRFIQYESIFEIRPDVEKIRYFDKDFNFLNFFILLDDNGFVMMMLKLEENYVGKSDYIYIFCSDNCRQFKFHNSDLDFNNKSFKETVKQLSYIY